MPRTHYPIFSHDGLPRYVVAWDLHWKVLRCERVDAYGNFRDALGAEIDRLHRDGWEAESDARWGLVFTRRSAERTLLTLTPRDPNSSAPQAFSSFKS